MNAVSWLDAMGAPDKWRGALQSRGPRIAVWVLALALGVQAALIVTRFAGAGRSSGPALRSAAAPAPNRAPLDVAVITRSHLFGTAPAAQVNADAANAPATSMPLVLSGIIAAKDPKNGMAILGESATAAKVYAVGDSIPGGARLTAVYEDRVLIDRGGHTEALTLPRQSGGATPGPMPARAANPAESVRRIIDEQPGLIGRVLRPQPVFIEGKQRGFRVYPGTDRVAFMRLGLRPGDMVTAINGTPLDDPGRADEIMRTLGSATEAHVTVMRNGHQQDLTLNLSQIATEADQLSQQPPPAEPAPTPPGSD